MSAGRSLSPARIPAPLWPLASIASAQISAAVSVPVIQAMGANPTTALRLGLAAIMLLAISRPKLRGVSRHAWTGMLLLGLATGGMSIAFYEAIGRIPLGLAVSIEFLGPLGVAVMGLKRPRDVIWILLAALGVICLTHHPGGRVQIIGFLFAFCSACCWGAYILLTRRVGAAFTGFQGLALSMSVAALVVLPLGAPGWVGLTPRLFAITLCSTMLSPLVTFTVEMAALRMMEARLFGIMMSLEPAAGALAAFILLGQRLDVPQLLGLLLVCIASLGAVLASAPPAPALER